MANEISRRSFLVLAPALSMPSLSLGAVMKMPVRMPFAAEIPGTKLDLEVEVSHEGPYWFTLRFPYKIDDQSDFLRVRKLTGEHGLDANGNVVPSGVPLKIRLAVDGPGLSAGPYDKVSNTTLAAYGSGYVTKMIDSIYLRRGRYRVHVESLLRAPEFDGANIEFTVGRDPKAA